MATKLHCHLSCQYSPAHDGRRFGCRLSAEGDTPGRASFPAWPRLLRLEDSSQARSLHRRECPAGRHQEHLQHAVLRSGAVGSDRHRFQDRGGKASAYSNSGGSCGKVRRQGDAGQGAAVSGLCPERYARCGIDRSGQAPGGSEPGRGNRSFGAVWTAIGLRRQLPAAVRQQQGVGLCDSALGRRWLG
uniref:Uncharacterized protein n=1 Tax=Hyaloperonospora arabidopsidis (strain Emoy2) TaxID=559515 RepID=M4C677_HYAAE